MWIKTIAKFRPPNIEDVEWETYDNEQKIQSCEPRKFRFDSAELETYNETRGETTIRMKSGYDITIEMKVEELDKLLEK